MSRPQGARALLRTTSAAEVGVALATSVAPLITPHNLIAHDEPGRFSRPKESRGHPPTGS